MLWVAYAAVAVAVSWLIWKLYVSYNSFGGTEMVIVYDAAVYPPIIAVVALYFILTAHKVSLALWMYLIIWVLITAVAAGAIKLMEYMGDRPL